MQLTPRYGDAPVLGLVAPIGDPAVPMLRQRARLASQLALLDEDQWAAPSRCEGWSVQDVITHLISTNQFWAFSIGAGLKGEPTQFLANFDPVASPAELVAAAAGATPAETLARFVETNDALAATVAELDEDALDTLAEAPPGHIAIRLVVLHALWDAWVHERDIALPLGLETIVEPDEILGCLTYAAALGPAFYVSSESGRTGSLAIDVSDPEIRFVVDVGEAVVVRDGAAPEGAVTLRGDAVALVEALSCRAPLDQDVDEDDRWLLGGLAEVFEVDASR